MFKNEVVGRYVIANQMSWTKFIEQLDNDGEYDAVIDEMYHSGGYDEAMLTSFTENMAKDKSIILMAPEAKLSDVFYNLYKTSEKGLS